MSESNTVTGTGTGTGTGILEGRASTLKVYDHERRRVVPIYTRTCLECLTVFETKSNKALRCKPCAYKAKKKREAARQRGYRPNTTPDICTECQGDIDGETLLRDHSYFTLCIPCANKLYRNPLKEKEKEGALRTKSRPRLDELSDAIIPTTSPKDFGVIQLAREVHDPETGEWVGQIPEHYFS